MKPSHRYILAGALLLVLLIGAFAAPVAARTTLAEAKASAAGTGSTPAAAGDTAATTMVVMSADAATNEVFNSGEHFGPFEGTRAMIPGKIEAEKYDIGGQGFAWFDTTKGNQGGAYRQDDVDIESGGSGHVVAFVKSSEWMIYSVNIAEAAKYTATFHVSSPWEGRQIWVWLDNSALLAKVNVPNTGSFDTYKDVNVDITLPKGLHYLKFEFEKDSQNLDYVTFEKATSTGTGGSSTGFNSGEHFGPFEGTRAMIPGKVEAEKYDIGGQGFAWFDTTKGNQGGVFRQDDVDIEKGATGDVVAFVKSSEWMIYSVNIEEAATYKATIHASSPWADRQVWIWLDNAVLKAKITVPETGSFNTYADASAEFTLPKGLHYLKFEFEKDSQNLDYVTFEKVTSTGTGGSSTGFNSGEHFGPFEGTRAMIPGKVEAEKYDIGGQGFAWFDTTKGNRGGAFRQDDVDIEKGATGDVVAFVKSSEWMIYSVDIKEAGTYKATIHASSPWADRQVWIWLDDAVLKAKIAVPDTKSFNTYADASAEFTLPKGLHYLKFEFEKDSQNLDYVTFEKVA